MIRHTLLLGLAGLALARPEIYKENEEFKYSRSSTDEGSKRGFYEAQRGNVGGNYERAHNMDAVAQGQMSEIVDQVGAQAPEVSGSNHGDVFGQSSSRGVYGQRKFDTGNLAGRNFQENVYDSSSSASSHNSRYQHGYGTGLYSSDLHKGGQTTGLYTGRQTLGTQYGTSGGLATEALGGSQSTGSNYGYGTSHSSGFESSSQQKSATYDHSRNVDNSQFRVVPVRIAVRPMQPVSLAVAVAPQQESDSYIQNTHDSRVHSRNSLVDHIEPVNTGTLVTGGAQSGAKQYESKYQYHKEWEKHSDVAPLPLAIVAPTARLETFDERDEAWRQNHLRQSQATGAQFNTNALRRGVVVSEKGSNSDYQYQRVAEPISNQYVVLSPTPDIVLTELKNNARNSHSSGYSKGSRSESLSSYGAHSSQGHHSDNLSVGSSSRDALTADTNTATIESTDPKSYASSYSYHKAWERQGDPYIIKPATGPLSQSYTNNYNTKTGSYSADDCDEHQRFRRSPYRSYTPQAHVDSYEDYDQQTVLLGQQTEDLGQQTEKLGKIDVFDHKTEDLGQQTEAFYQQPEERGRIKNIDQQTEDLGQWTEQFSQQREKLTHQEEHENQKIQNNHRGWQYVYPRYRPPVGGQEQV